MNLLARFFPLGSLTFLSACAAVAGVPDAVATVARDASAPVDVGNNVFAKRPGQSVRVPAATTVRVVAHYTGLAFQGNNPECRGGVWDFTLHLDTGAFAWNDCLVTVPPPNDYNRAFVTPSRGERVLTADELAMAETALASVAVARPQNYGCATDGSSWDVIVSTADDSFTYTLEDWAGCNRAADGSHPPTVYFSAVEAFHNRMIPFEH